jgi:protein-disulfide isomerase
MNRRSWILATGVGAIAAFGGATWWATRPTPNETNTVSSELLELLERPHSPTFGRDDAPVTIVEFFDPACEACRAFHPVVKDILAQYPDDVRIVLRYTPFHGLPSETAIKILETARLQGVFEPVLEALYTYQNVWAAHGAPSIKKIGEIAGAAGLDVQAAAEQMKMPDIVAVFNQDRSDVEAVGVRQTPTFFVNGKPLDPFGESELRALVAAEVEAAGS